MVIANSDHLCDSEVRGELPSLHSRVERTNVSPLDFYFGLSYACDAVVIYWICIVVDRMMLFLVIC